MRFEEIFGKSPSGKLLAVSVGAVFYGLSVGLFFAPNDIAPGGASGVAVMVNTILPIGVGSLTMLINLPLLIVAILKWGWRFLFSTIVAIIVSGVSADACALFPIVTENRLLAALFGGAVMGFGVGTVFRFGSTTGGTDIVSRLIKLKKPQMKISMLIFLLDGAIALTSGFVFKNAENVLYSMLAITVSSKVLDMVLYGADSARMIFVISNKSEAIRDCLINRENVGCTLLEGFSGYEGSDMQVILCAMRKQRLPSVKEAVLEIDNKAFMLVTNAGEVFGEGFKTNKSNF